MKLYTIDTGFFKLDGGAMFGVVPKSLWQRVNPSDEKNLCTWAMRCLLVEEGDKLVLIDTGLGDKQSEKFFSYFEPHGDDSLKGSLKKHGFSPDDVTDVILTHLHFDHCGGAVNRRADGTLEPAFKNAKYWSHRDHWKWANQPNERERASFLKENFNPIESNGQLSYINNDQAPFSFIDFKVVHGHTEAQILPIIDYKGQKIMYMADLIPSAGHISMPWVMAYDVRPLQTLIEKEIYLTEAIENNYFLFFEHDRNIEACSLKKTDRGVRMDESFDLSQI